MGFLALFFFFQKCDFNSGRLISNTTEFLRHCSLSRKHSMQIFYFYSNRQFESFPTVIIERSIFE